jgi:Tol biopolymer transport system component
MIVQRCLCKEPGERFPTMAEVKTRLEELVEPGEAPPRLSYRERRRRRWILSGVAAALAVLLAVGVRIVLQRAFPKTARAERFYAARFTTDAGLSSFPAISLDGRSVAYASDRAGNGNLNLWVQHWGQGDARQITFNPADETSPSFFPSGERLVYRSEQDHGGLYTISSFGGDARLLVPGGRDGRFSRNGRWLAYWKGQVGGAFHRDCAKIYIMPAAGGEPQEFPKGFEAAAYPVWSSTGTQLIFLGRKAGSDTADWWVAGLQDGVARPTGLLEKLSKLGVARPSRSFLLAPADWLPDQTVLFAGRGFDTTNIWAVQVNADGTVPDEPRQWTGGTGIEDYPGAAIASSDGSVRTVFAALTAATAIWRVPLTPDGTAAGPAERLISGFAKLGSPSVSVDGRKLAFSAHQPGGEIVRLADLGSQTHEAPSVMTLDSQASYPVLSGDGSTIAWVSKSTGYVSATQGGAPIEVCHPCGPPSHLTFDGTAALFEGAGASEDLLLVVRGQKPRTLFHTPAGPPWMQSTGHFSPNQHWVAFSAWHEGSEAKQILIVPVTADGLVPAGQIIEVTHDEFVNRAPVWSTDGRRIYFLSNRDSSDCVWARDVDPATARPLGEAFPVAHFHYAAKAIRGPVAYSGSVGLSVARNFLVLTLTETTGSVWVRSNKPRL